MSMNFKLQFPTWTLNSDAKIYKIDLSEEGAPIETLLFDGKVNYVKKAKQVLNAQRQLVLISGILIIPNDIGNQMDDNLLVKIEGIEKRVSHTNKFNNPDQTVFSTEIFLL